MDRQKTIIDTHVQMEILFAQEDLEENDIEILTGFFDDADWTAFNALDFYTYQEKMEFSFNCNGF